MARNKEYEKMLRQVQAKESKSTIRRIAEASMKLDKFQIIAGLALIGYGAIVAAGGPVVWGLGVAGSSVVTNWAANRVIAWDERRQARKSGEVKQVSKKKKSVIVYTNA